MGNRLKQLERGLRRRFLDSSKPFAGVSTDVPRDILGLGAQPKILFLRPDRIGDVLVSVPILRAVRNHLPAATLHMLLSRNNYSVRDAVAPFVDRFWRHDKTVANSLQLLFRLRQARYDLVVDLVDNPSAISHIVIRSIHPRAALGVLHARPGVYTHAVPHLDPARVHIVDRLAQLLLAFGIDPSGEPLDLAYPLTNADRSSARARLGATPDRVAFGINVSGRGAHKYWGRQNFIGFIRWLREAEPRVEAFICGAPGDAAEIQAIAEATGARVVPALPSLHDFAALIQQFNALLTPDTSVVHLAAAGKVPTIALYHAVPQAMPWLPYQTPHRAVVHMESLRQIALPDVIAAARSLMEECFPAQVAR